MNKDQESALRKIGQYFSNLSIGNSRNLSPVLDDYFARMASAMAHSVIASSEKPDSKRNTTQKSMAINLQLCQRIMLGNGILEYVNNSGAPINFQNLDDLNDHLRASAEEGIKFNPLISACNIINAISRTSPAADQKEEDVLVNQRYDTVTNFTDKAVSSLQQAFTRTKLSPQALTRVICDSLKLSREADQLKVRQMVELAAL